MHVFIKGNRREALMPLHAHTDEIQKSQSSAQKTTQVTACASTCSLKKGKKISSERSVAPPPPNSFLTLRVWTESEL